MRFDELDLENEILDGIDAMNFQEMTPVQELTIPIILEGKDIIGCAQILSINSSLPSRLEIFFNSSRVHVPLLSFI